MATIPTTPKRGTGNLLRKWAVAAALSACSLAQAGVLDFETPTDSPFVFAGDHIQLGKFWIESYGAPLTTDMVGSFINGSDSEICIALSCPVNNTSQYYAGLGDGYFYFGMNDDSNFRVKSLQASFMRAGADSVAVKGALLLQGFDAGGTPIGAVKQLDLPGANGSGQFNFTTFDLGSFTDTSFSYVLVLGYACDATNGCSRTSTLANFAIDNIETVPEPMTWALIGLGLIGLGISRRRAA